MEVKLTSRMLTTIETKPHINNVRQKLDTLFKQGSNNTYEVIFNNNYICNITC